MGDNAKDWVNSDCHDCPECKKIHFNLSNDIIVECDINGDVWPRKTCPDRPMETARVVRKLELR